jgi:hypothetical protein
MASRSKDEDAFRFPESLWDPPTEPPRWAIHDLVRDVNGSEMDIHTRGGRVVIEIHRGAYPFLFTPEQARSAAAAMLSLANWLESDYEN